MMLGIYIYVGGGNMHSTHQGGGDIGLPYDPEAG